MSAVLTASTHPQVITGSHDSTVKLWDLAAAKCFTTLTHHYKSVRGLSHATGIERTFVSASADGTVRKFQGKDGKFLQTISNDRKPIWNCVSVQEDGVMVTGGDDGSLEFWDYKSGCNFQSGNVKVQPGSLEQAEKAVFTSTFDGTGTRLITGHADKTIQIWKEDEEASELSHPIDTKAWKKAYVQQQERI